MRAKARRDGGVTLTFDAGEPQVLARLAASLRDRYVPTTSADFDGAAPDPAHDPVRDRLFPRAYLDPTADAAEAEWRDAVHPELLRERLDGLDHFVVSLQAVEASGRRHRLDLEPPAVDTWIMVLNDVRLMLGTLLGVTDDSDFSRIDPAHPFAQEQAVYAWCTALQGALVEAMLATLPDD